MSKKQDYSNFLKRIDNYFFGVLTGTIGGLLASWILITAQSSLNPPTPKLLIILSLITAIPIFIIILWVCRLRIWIYKRKHKIK